MKIALIGAELEENLGLRYMAAALEQKGHQVNIVSYNTEKDIPRAVNEVLAFGASIAGLSMVFTSRAMEFCRLAEALRAAGYSGHIIAGGHFASLNCERLLKDYQAFDSVGLGEGEELVCNLAKHLDSLSSVPGLYYRTPDGRIATNPSTGNPDDLNALPFPKRTTFHAYFDKPIASVLTSRGCWRDCAFCSINAWYKQGGGKKFRTRSVENIVAEMKDLYFNHGIRIFNFQDDNFFLPNRYQALERFKDLRDRLFEAGIHDIAIAVKARPDSINYDAVKVLDELGLFRVFLGVENASQHGLNNLNRRCSLEEILNALQVLNDFDVHIAYNLLMFEPDTLLDDILVNLRFMEKHIENPFNFCRAEAYAGTGLEAKLVREGRLLGDYFGFDYRLKDPRSEAFHQIANYAFFDRNFSDFGLHYFNMQIDFYFQLLRRFHPELLTEALRARVRNFIKQTNLDTYECLCQIYDFVKAAPPDDQVLLRSFARQMREIIDDRSAQLHKQGEWLLQILSSTYEGHEQQPVIPELQAGASGLSVLNCRPVPYMGLDRLVELQLVEPFDGNFELASTFGIAATPIPYPQFKQYLSEQKT